MRFLSEVLAGSILLLLGLHLGVQKCRPSVDRDGDAGFWEAGW